MPTATNEQVQAFVDQRLRPRAEQIRNLMVAIDDDLASIGDVWLNINATSPVSTWVDTRIDSPPALLDVNDIKVLRAILLALQSFRTGTFANVLDANANATRYTRTVAACVRPV